MALIDSTPITRIAAGDLTGKLNLCGKETSTGFTVCTTLGERVDGIIGNEPKAIGMPVEVYHCDRQFKALAGATFAAGVKLSTLANGKLTTALTGHHVVGISVNAGVDGRIIEVMKPIGHIAP